MLFFYVNRLFLTDVIQLYFKKNNFNVFDEIVQPMCDNALCNLLDKVRMNHPG